MRDPFDDEGEAADARAGALASLLAAHGRVSLERAVADLHDAQDYALLALARLEEAQATVTQWALRVERSIDYVGQAHDALSDKPCTCAACRARRASPKTDRDGFTRHPFSDLPLRGERDDAAQ